MKELPFIETRKLEIERSGKVAVEKTSRNIFLV